MTPKRLPLPKRMQVATTDAAYQTLRDLNARTGLSNNYLLTILLERLHDFADPAALEKSLTEFISEYGAPAPGAMKGQNRRA